MKCCNNNNLIYKNLEDLERIDFTMILHDFCVLMAHCKIAIHESPGLHDNVMLTDKAFEATLSFFHRISRRVLTRAKQKIRLTTRGFQASCKLKSSLLCCQIQAPSLLYIANSTPVYIVIPQLLRHP